MSVEVWTEKYRPDRLDEVVNHEQIISRLKAFVEDENIPHLLFSGPAGTGKTASSLAIAHELFGDSWKDNVLELNASDTRGIDTIRNQVKDFARSRSIGDVPFKMIILDEADALTPEAQQALRRTMENYTETCRFCLICNYSSKIIDPIRSRCSIFRFPRLDRDDALELMERICDEEDVDYTEKGLDAVISVSQGDLRKAINLLQSVA
ncbi:MAG: replication factor C small subunit, partial [Candidatus Aenigmatarchaeota archaeon]